MDRATGEPIELLLVEDNPADARLFVEALDELQVAHRLHHVPDGEEAAAFLRRRGPYADAPRPDLVFLDLNLPRKDGRELLAEVKADPDLRRIPVIVVTGSRAEADVARSYDLHANCYVIKPIDLGQFLAAVRLIESFWCTAVRLPQRAAD